DGRQLLVGTRDGSLHAWNVANARQTDLQPQGDAVVALTCTPDGRFFASGTRGGIVRLWDAVTLAPVGLVHRGNRDVNGLSFHPDGHTLAIGSSDGSIWICRIPAARSLGAPIRSFPEAGDEVHTVAFDATGKTLLTCGFQGARLWDPATGAAVGPGRFVAGSPAAAALSPDAKLVALGGVRGNAALRGATTAAVKHRTGSLMGGTVHPTLFSPDGRWWLTMCARNSNAPVLPSGSWLWDLSAAEPKPRPVQRSLGPVAMAAAFHPNGQTLLLGCQDGTARFWDVAA